jgi:hypothetical protein
VNQSIIRWALVFAVALAVVGLVQAQRPATTPAVSGIVLDSQPDLETLKRLAQQLGAGQQQGPIDPKMMEAIQKFLKDNPNYTKSSQFQEQLQQMKQQYDNDPNFAQQLKNKFSPDDLNKLKQYFPNATGNSSPGNPFGSQTPPSSSGIPPQPNQTSPPTLPQNPLSGTQNPLQGLPGNGQNPPGQQLYPPGNMPPSINPWDPNAAKILAQNNKEFAQVAGFWESNFGSLDNTPALKKSLVEMFSGNGQSPWNGMGGNGNNSFNGMNGQGMGGTKPWWNEGGLGNGGSGGGFANWFNNVTANGGPSWWKSMTNSSGPSWLKGWSSNFSAPNHSSGFNTGGGFDGFGSVGGSATGLGAAGTTVLFIILALIVGFLVYRYWPAIQAMRNQPKALPGLGKWPIDPRNVKDRETLVRAFEYFSVFLCGDGARVWNHVTIAEAFRENVPASAPFADQLARLYAIARYTPAREEIAASDLATARRYLCQLAGVSEA